MERQLLVLARRDTLEAMRVAAGLTIFGHKVTLILMRDDLQAIDEHSELLELLELADINPLTTMRTMVDRFALVSSQQLGASIGAAHGVLNF